MAGYLCDMEWVVAVFSVILTLSKAQIMFLQEPKNVTVFEGMDAFFPCYYHGTSGIPTWRIANHEFATSALPPRYFYNGSGLVVSNVDLSLNMTSYSCFFIVYGTEGQFVDIESTTGYLYISAPIEVLATLKLTTDPTTPSPTTTTPTTPSSAPSTQSVPLVTIVIAVCVSVVSTVIIMATILLLVYCCKCKRKTEKMYSESRSRASNDLEKKELEPGNVTCMITHTDSHLRKSSLSVSSSTIDHSTSSMRTPSSTYKSPHSPSASSSSPSTFEFMLKQKQMMESGDTNLVEEENTVVKSNPSEGCTIVGDNNTYHHVTNSISDSEASIHQDYHHHANTLWPASGNPDT